MDKKRGYFSNTFTVINNAILKNTNLRKIKSLYYYIDAVLLLFIKKPKKVESKKKKVMISFNLSLGDGAIFLTALKNIRQIYPNDEYEITLACQKGLNKMYEKLNLFDKVIPLNYTGSTVNLKNRLSTLKELRKNYYDIAIDPIGIEECTMNVLMNRVICADKKVGLINIAKEMYCPKNIYKKVYTDIIEINNEKVSYIEQYNEFFNNLSDKKFQIEFTTLPSEKTKEQIPQEYFIVYPSASTEYKRWPLDRFVEITKRTYNLLNIPVMLCGTAIDEEINNKLKEELKEIPIIDMTNKTNILEYLDLIKNAKLVIANDTGIYHIATISQVPVVILAGGYTFDKYVAYDFKGKENFKRPIIITDKNIKCYNCENRCIYKDKINKTWPCLDNILVEDAWKVIEENIKGK